MDLYKKKVLFDGIMKISLSKRNRKKSYCENVEKSFFLQVKFGFCPRTFICLFRYLKVKVERSRIFQTFPSHQNANYLKTIWMVAFSELR